MEVIRNLVAFYIVISCPIRPSDEGSENPAKVATIELLNDTSVCVFTINLQTSRLVTVQRPPLAPKSIRPQTYLVMKNEQRKKHSSCTKQIWYEGKVCICA